MSVNTEESQFLNSDEESRFWGLVRRQGLPRWRWFRKSKTIQDVDDELSGWKAWELLKPSIRDGDRIWPFHIQVRKSLGDRWGYVVLRKGKPIGGVITAVS